MGQFDRFKKEHTSGAKKKELFKQEKRKVKKETEDFHKQKKKESRSAKSYPAAKAGERPERTPGKGNAAPRITRASSDYEIFPLNKFIAHSGLCSRREAAERIKAGDVKVNGAVELNPGYKVLPTDDVVFNGKKAEPRRQMVYILLNKPKDFITTADDDKGRKTVLDIVKNATDERIFPVGRLDRNTTGVLLLTNDGELTQHLTHPSFEVRKIYEVTLDKPVTKDHIEQLLQGVTLEDGLVNADAVGYADPKDKSVVGVEIHSGKNRVVRRMFEHLGYDVRALDRVMFANLTKKTVDRGKWRFLNDKEVRLLKFFNKSKRKTQEDRVELQDTPFMGRPSTPKRTGPKRESSGSDAPKRETTRRETDRSNSPRRDARGSETPKRETYKSESPASDYKKRESSGSEAPKRDSYRKESPRSESQRRDSRGGEGPKRESYRKESPRSDSPRRDARSSEAPKKESYRKESPRSESPRRDSRGSDAPKNGRARREATENRNKRDAPRNASQGNDSPRSGKPTGVKPKSDGPKPKRKRIEKK
jgi:23S rRNA pseudouridine2605 synthase